ncbi:hypothetical protein E1281_05320 [Actinomadura sp. KC345]|uniref:hypothetical protein n=1 Tax=Actinomadura sp. KC345 TaxID=2530371 RepID=UPI001044017E|nr:hypothetical protein [Actinomadura sp. KC345]TDC57300.1 hypothetical protein E1281_05320 [Actinomadura sp. KC345]
MEDSRTGPVPGASHPVPGAEHQPARGRPAARAYGEQPSERAYPLLVLTPVHESRATRETWTGAVPVVATGIAVLVVTAELGRRAGVPVRLTTACSAAGFAVVVVPRLVVSAPRPRLRHWHRPAVAAAVN